MIASDTGCRHSSDSSQHGPLYQKPSIKELQWHRIIIDIGPKWYELGIALLHADQLNKLGVIKSDHKEATRCCTEMFIYWLATHSNATWYQLTEALRSPGVELNNVAANVETSFPATEPRNEEITAGMVVVSAEQIEEKFEVTNQQQHFKSEVADKCQHVKTEVAEETQEELQSKQSQLVLSKISESTTTHVADTTTKTVKRMAYSAFNATCSQPGLSDDKIGSSEDSQKSERICKAVSDFCLGQFEDRWKARTKSSTINVIAALLVEKPGEKMPKVVVLATGTTMKRECSYSLNKGDANEYMWGLCDGHAESVCYRLASFYLINEIHKHSEKSGNSILENNGGYALRDGIKFHFFTTQPPCGFMANEKRYYLSWRIPFKEKPHCLKCSSTILIGTYLGIQGPLSHLFREPIYISSITIPKSKNFTTERCTYIKNSFKNFKAMFDKIVNDGGNIYKLLIPDVEIAEIELQKLFPCYFISYDNEDFSKFLKEVEESHSEKESKKAAGAVSTNSNIGSHIMVFNLKDGICDLKDEVREDTELKLKSAAKQFFLEEMIKQIKQVNLKQLRKAQRWLSKVLDINEALKGLQSLVTEKMDNNFSEVMYQNDDTVSRQLSELEQYKCKLGELHVKVNNFKKLFCADMKQFEESDDNIQTVIPTTSLSDAAKKVRNNSKAMMDNLDLLNDSMNDLEIDTKSVADKLVDYHHCKETWDDLQTFMKSMEKVVSSCDCLNLFNQELMGCDWARYMKSMDKDIEDN